MKKVLPLALALLPMTLVIACDDKKPAEPPPAAEVTPTEPAPAAEDAAPTTPAEGEAKPAETK